MLDDHCDEGQHLNAEHKTEKAETGVPDGNAPLKSDPGTSSSGSPLSVSGNLEGHCTMSRNDPPKPKVKLSKNELLDSTEFNKTIAAWFGEKGFIAMRSFFRASVLNSLQKNRKGVNEANCTGLDAVVVTLIADYLAKNGKYFTMSVFSNEMLRPLVNANPNLKQVLLKIGKCEDMSEPTLTEETVCFVMDMLNIRTHSALGVGILRKYLEDRSEDLLSIILGLLRDNARVLNVDDRPVRDDDVVAAFSEGLNEEIGKLHRWFSDFNCQFVGVSGKLKKLVGSRADGGKNSSRLEEQELWNQMVRMDEHLRKQQECLLKMRDRERKKLASYAKELEDLHEEMNLKLKSIQDYEKTLKIREKALRENGATLEHCGKGDCSSPDSRLHRFDPHFRDQLESQEYKLQNSAITGRIMEENLELKALLREQSLRIETLTRKTALLSAGYHGDESTTLHSTTLGCGNRMTSRETDRRDKYPAIVPNAVSHPKPFSAGGGLLSAMSSSVRRSRMEIDSLRDEQNTADSQYGRLLNNKLSKRL